MKTRAGRGEKVAVATFFAILSTGLIGALLVTGALDNLIYKRQHVSIAFTESVTGLTVGSPVTYFGVRIGEVTELTPMDHAKAKKLMEHAKVIVPKGDPIVQGGDKLYEAWTKGYSEAKTAEEAPHVLAIVVVDEGALPLNPTTRATLQLVNLAGSFAIKIESEPKTDPQLAKQDVVIVADISSLGSLQERLLDENKGLLRKDNVETLSHLADNLSQISLQVRDLLGKQKDNLNQIVDSTAKITATLDEWTSGKDPKIGRTLDDLRTVSDRLERWTRDDANAEGQLATLLRKTNRLEDDVAKLVEPNPTDPNIPSLVRTGDDLGKSLTSMTTELNRLVGSVEGLLVDNRERIERLTEDFDHLARRVDLVMSQLDQDPSSVIWGRRGKEMEPGK